MFEPYYRNTAPEWVSGPAISLRDWFAGHALWAVYARTLLHTNHKDGWADTVAHRAYLLADAMLKERSKE